MCGGFELWLFRAHYAWHFHPSRETSYGFARLFCISDTPIFIEFDRFDVLRTCSRNVH